jgi:hypothetical protein
MQESRARASASGAFLIDVGRCRRDCRMPAKRHDKAPHINQETGVPQVSDDSLVLARFVWRLVDEGVIPSRLVPTRVAEALVRALPDIHHKIIEDVDADVKPCDHGYEDTK